MILTYLLDTNMVSYIVRGRSISASNRLLALNADEVACISVVTEAEILYGLYKRPEATALKELMDAFLSSLPVLPWGREEADTYGRIRSKLERGGITLGNMDIMIASHAIATGATLVSNDRAFAHIEELRGSVNWATDL